MVYMGYLQLILRMSMTSCAETANLSRANTKSRDNIDPRIPSDLPVFRVQSYRFHCFN
jgi:hypothetical protein